ncbi:MAG: ribose-phosphate diphosphokinase [Nanoarchaeota archaeon]|nr:ribose-phosphate diphosphokinase [Nanoarchaeota archaeon]
MAMPVIFATRSGKSLGSKIAFELSKVLYARNHRIADEEWNPLILEERKHIDMIKAFNRHLFGNKSGHFCLRHIEIEDFSNEELHIVISDYKRQKSRRDDDDSITDQELILKRNTLLTDQDMRIVNSVRGQDVYLVHSPYEPRPELTDIIQGLGRNVRRQNQKERAFDTNEIEEIIKRVRKERSVNDNLVEGWLTAYTLAKWAKRVTLLCPYMVGSRQDHSREREASTAKLIATIDQVIGLNHAIFTDLHSPQIAEFYDVSAENLRASNVLVPEIETELRKEGYNKVIYRKVVSSPDAGGAKKARYYARKIGGRVVIGDKHRNYSLDNTVDEVMLVGEEAISRNAVVLAVDDMIDTGGSIKRLVEKIAKRKPVAIYLACSHAILSGEAINTLDKLYHNGLIKKLITTDSISRPNNFSKNHPWYHEISLAPMYAETIYSLNNEKSVSKVYADTRKIKVVHFPNFDNLFNKKS